MLFEDGYPDNASGFSGRTIQSVGVYRQMVCAERIVFASKQNLRISRKASKMFISTHYEPGDWVIYRKQKSSTIPGPRAENVHAASKGNLYRYTVDKFWVVQEIDSEGQLHLKTRRGKCHLVASDDPQLRKARLWERWLYRNRFEQLDSDADHADAATGPDSVQS